VTGGVAGALRAAARGGAVVAGAASAAALKGAITTSVFAGLIGWAILGAD